MDISYSFRSYFAATSIALKSLYDHKNYLQPLVVCSDHKKFLKLQKGREVKQNVLDEKFWKNCLTVMKIIGLLIRLLRICDSDEKPAMGYVYDGVYRLARELKNYLKIRNTCISLILPLSKIGGIGPCARGYKFWHIG